MGFEPTTTGTTIRGSTAELRPPSSLHRSAATIYTLRGENASQILFLLIFFYGEAGEKAGEALVLRGQEVAVLILGWK